MQLKSHSFTEAKTKKIPGPRPLPIIGNLPSIGQHKHVTFNQLAKKYGDIFQVNILIKPVVVLNRLETIKQALQKQQEDFAGRPDFPTLRDAVKGRTIGGRDYGLLFKRQREIILSTLRTFFSKNIPVLEQQVIEEANELANIFLDHQDQPFDPEVEIGLAVTNIILSMLFGKRDSRSDLDCIELSKCGRKFVANSAGALVYDFMPQARVFCEGGLKVQHACLDTLERVVLKRLNGYKESYDPENLRTLTDLLLKATSEVDESERKTLGLDEYLLVEGATQELVGTGLQPIFPILRWALLYMIAHPEIQAEIQQELDRVVGRERSVRLEDQEKLPFMQACIHEILRCAPFFPLGLPHSTTTDTTLNGYFIPKDTPVFVNLYSLTRDERYWEEPDKFNPHRFLNENREIREDLLDKYYPFSMGKRRCFGEYLGRFEVFLFLANLMHKCKFERVAGEKLGFDGCPGAIIHTEDYQVIVKPRF